MSGEAPQGNWQDIKGKIKSRWGKLESTDIDGFKDKMHLIADKVQKVYGITKDKAEQEYNDFKKTIEEKVKS